MHHDTTSGSKTMKIYRKHHLWQKVSGKAFKIGLGLYKTGHKQMQYSVDNFVDKTLTELEDTSIISKAQTRRWRGKCFKMFWGGRSILKYFSNNLALQREEERGRSGFWWSWVRHKQSITRMRQEMRRCWMITVTDLFWGLRISPIFRQDWSTDRNLSTNFSLSRNLCFKW